MHFTVTKFWADDGNESARPTGGQFYIWRMVEKYAVDADGNEITDENGKLILSLDTTFSFAIPNCYASYSVPTEDGHTMVFERDLGDDKITHRFPMYDGDGRRYIYFGMERGIPASYSTKIDNSDALAMDDVIAYFEGTNYFLNGADITNTYTATQPLGVSKQFDALSIQNIMTEDMHISVEFLLQKWNGAENRWETADAKADGILCDPEDPHITVDEESGALTVTLDDFTAESMEDSFADIRAPQIDTESRTEQKYRWVETLVSVNDVSAQYDPAKWQTLADDRMVYQGDIVVKDGQKSVVLKDSETKTSGPENTTAVFHAFAQQNSFTNKLVGNYQLEIRKVFYDAQGRNISGDSGELGNVEITFQIYRDDAPFEQVTMSYADYAQGQDCWLSILNYDRYDDRGREYRFKVEEISTTDNRSWSRTENYQVAVVEDPRNPGVLIKRLVTNYVNAPGPENVLVFDVEKEWLDDSDLQTRNPVVAAIYRIKDFSGELLEQPEQVSQDIVLKMSNNWYQKIVIPAADEQDETDNYVILEKGILVGETLVPTSFHFAESSANLETVRAQIASGNTEIGIVGSLNAEGETDWDGLSYRYKVLEQKTDKEGMASYVLTNLRIGTQNYTVVKTWKDGGQVRAGRFALFLEGRKLGSYRLNVVDGAVELSEIVWEDPAYAALYAAGEIALSTIGSGNAVVNIDGNYSAGMKISGLPKFSSTGAQLNYSVDEIQILSDDGEFKDVDNGKCIVQVNAGEQTYNKMYAVSQVSTVRYAAVNRHRSPDEFQVNITNAVSNSYDLVSNKVWRDAKDSERPDLCFSVYRISTRDSVLRNYVNTGNTEAMSAYLAGKAIPENRMILDSVWNTRINNYWWTSTIQNMAQYDADGYPYVYFGVENLSSNQTASDPSGLYKRYYCNETAENENFRPVNPAGVAAEELRTQQVFGILTENLAPADGNVFIISDGTHVGAEGFGDYYSATVVNRPERHRTVNGEKLWKLPQGWTVSAEEMPTVKVELYRTTEEITASGKTTAEYLQVLLGDETHAPAVVESVFENGGSTAVVNTVDTAFDQNAKTFKYEFRYDRDGVRLPKYDAWGTEYYYYTIESSESSPNNFPREKVVYEDNDFNISNVFSSQPPYVEVKVQKKWQLEDDVAQKLLTYGLTASANAEFDLSKMASATIHLKGIPLNSSGDPIDGAEFDFGSCTLNPADLEKPDSNIEIVTEEVDGKTVSYLTADYTFTDFYNSETKQREQLPYYWLRTNRVAYYLSEEDTKGYREEYSELPVVFDNSREETIAGNPEKVLVWINDSAFDVTNTYNDDEFTTFQFKKIWNDRYVDNNLYRPESVEFTVKRKVDNVVDPLFEKKVVLNRSDFQVNGVNKFEWEGALADPNQADGLEHLLKYAPSGKPYVYFLYSETIGTGDGAETAVKKGDPVGNYVLEQITEKAISNSLLEGLSVEAAKNWTVNGTSVTDWSNEDNTGFYDLRKLDVFPEKVQFLLQRRTEGGDWKYVPSSLIQDAVHTVILNETVTGETASTSTKYVGREVNLDSATESTFRDMLQPRMKWDNLPRKDLSSGKTYEYRVIEILKWHSGPDTRFTPDATEQDHGVTPAFAGNLQDGFTLENAVLPKKVRIMKVWEDENGYNNTRPDQIKVTVRPADAVYEHEEDMPSFLLQTSGNQETDDNVYYSEWFWLPQNVDITFGSATDNYLITESLLKADGSAYTGQVPEDPNFHLSANGALYEQTIVSGPDTVIHNPDGSWNLKITNTHIVERKTETLQASKLWSGDSGWADVTRPQISFKLQYLTRGDSPDWKDITDMSAFSGNGTQSAEQTVPAEGQVRWTQMFKYWTEPDENGRPQPIRYRIVETVKSADGKASYLPSAPVELLDDNKPIGESTVTATAELTNTYASTTLALQKAWTRNGTSEQLSTDTVEKLIALKAIPEQLTFVIEWKNGTEWAEIVGEGSGTVTGMTVALLNSVSTGIQLPRYDSLGNEIVYRVRETGFLYRGEETVQPVDTANGSGTQGGITASAVEFRADGNASQTVALTNDYACRDLTVTKVWQDEGNRDGVRGNITLQLSRDGSLYSQITTGDSANNAQNLCTVTKQGDVWTVVWKDLPKYQAGTQAPWTAEKESVYSWAESTGVQGYSASYNSDSEAAASRTEVKNTYEPQRGTVKASKNWVDYAPMIETRPDEIYLKLQFRIGENGWQDVAQKSLKEFDGKWLYVGEQDAILDGSMAYTTDADGWRTVKAADNWPEQEWKNLPAYARVDPDGTGPVTLAVTYRVVEGIKGNNGTITQLPEQTKQVRNYTASYTEVNLLTESTKNADVTNTLDKVSLTVSKTWEGTVFGNLVSPKSAVFQVEYRKAGGSWAPIPPITVDDQPVFANLESDSTVILPGANGTKTVSNLPKADATGTPFEYRVTEAKIVYTDDSEAAAQGTMVGPYDSAVMLNNYTASAVNKLIVGSLTVKNPGTTMITGITAESLSVCSSSGILR